MERLKLELKGGVEFRLTKREREEADYLGSKDRTHMSKGVKVGFSLKLMPTQNLMETC